MIVQVVLTMDEVYRDILSWDFYGIISGQATRQGLRGLGKVPTFFDDLQHYSRVFWALLLEELRAHIQQVHKLTIAHCQCPCYCLASDDDADLF